MSSTIYDLLIYRRDGTCLYNRTFTNAIPPTKEKEEREKLVYGMLFSLKELLPSLSPTTPTLKSISLPPLTLYTTTSPTGYTIVLHAISKSTHIDWEERLRKIYEVWTEKVVMCGMWDPSQPGESGVLENTEFDREIQIVIRSFEK
ncbi:hypothetical protein TL16_g02637 [Triparma laevis f. inornata]|uniref:Trafficking protein particle complex subunit n=2 Tax=Triparma laevis TaxID=1534972 RepID=A0A9W7F733_9STRA|nr:hypothetical protein TL16_g02637 [Triparma laevis f. inornata]GMI03713.1 hypothetical protein TrLO_g1589 [Triparma laevis f. longispina]